MAKTSSGKPASGKPPKTTQLQTARQNVPSVQAHQLPLVNIYTGEVTDVGGDSWLEVIYKGAVQYNIWKNEQEDRERERAVSEREAYIESRRKNVERSNALLKQANEHLKNCQKSMIIVSPEEYVNAAIPRPVIPDRKSIYNRHGISPVSGTPLFGKRKEEFEKAKALAESEYKSENDQYVKDMANSKRERQKLLNDIEGGGVGAYSRYLKYALEKNVKHALYGYDTEFLVQSSAHFMQRTGKVQASISFPVFKEFRLLKALEYDDANDKVNKIYENDDKIRRETYKSLVKSLTLLVTAVVFECDSRYGFVNTVYTIGSRGFLQESTGMEFYYGICELSMSADTYSDLYVKDLVLNSFYEAKDLDFNADFFEDAFFIDTVGEYDEMKKKKETDKPEELPGPEAR